MRIVRCAAAASSRAAGGGGGGRGVDLVLQRGGGGGHGRPGREDGLEVVGARRVALLDGVDGLLAGALDDLVHGLVERGARGREGLGLVRAGRAGQQARERAPVALVRALQGLDRLGHLVLRGEVAVVDVEVLRDLGADALHARAHAAGELGRVQRDPVELAHVTAEGAELGAAERRDDDHREGERAEAEAEAAREREVLESLHGRWFRLSVGRKGRLCGWSSRPPRRLSPLDGCSSAGPRGSSREADRARALGGERQQPLALRAHRRPLGAGEPAQRGDLERPVADPPRPGEEAVHEQRVAVDDPRRVIVAEDPRAVGVREQRVVVDREEARRRGGVRVGQRRAREVEQLAPAIVAERAQLRAQAVDRRGQAGQPRPRAQVGGRRRAEGREVAPEQVVVASRPRPARRRARPRPWSARPGRARASGRAAAAGARGAGSWPRSRARAGRGRASARAIARPTASAPAGSASSAARAAASSSARSTPSSCRRKPPRSARSPTGRNSARQRQVVARGREMERAAVQPAAHGGAVVEQVGHRRGVERLEPRPQAEVGRLRLLGLHDEEVADRLERRAPVAAQQQLALQQGTVESSAIRGRRAKRRSVTASGSLMLGLPPTPTATWSPRRGRGTRTRTSGWWSPTSASCTRTATGCSARCTTPRTRCRTRSCGRGAASGASRAAAACARGCTGSPPTRAST